MSEKLHQLSVFVENKPGQLRAVCQALAEANFSILTMTLADTKEFGIARFVLPDWERAKQVLEEAGFVAKVTDVLALEVADRPGGLADVLAVIEEVNLNIEYMYALTFGWGSKAVLIFRFEDTDAALERLKDKPITLVSGPDLHPRVQD